MAEPADVSIIVRDGSPEPVCTVQVALKNSVGWPQWLVLRAPAAQPNPHVKKKQCSV